MSAAWWQSVSLYCGSLCTRHAFDCGGRWQAPRRAGRAPGSSIAQPLPEAQPRRLIEHSATQRDIRKRQAAVPEQDGFVLSLAPGFLPGDDLAHLAVQRRLRELGRLHVRAQRAELAGFALTPIVDDDLVHDIGERELDRAHRAIGYDEGACLDPRGLEHRCRLGEPRCLAYDIRALDTRAPVLRRPHRLAEIARETGGEGVPALGPARVLPDLVEVEQPVEQAYIPIGRAARAHVPENLRRHAREMLRADGGDRAR